MVVDERAAARRGSATRSAKTKTGAGGSRAQTSGASGAEPPKAKRGRPPGSISLTREKHDRIIGLVRAGVSPPVAARTVRIPERTLRDWIARGLGLHPTRPPTKKLVDFVRDLDQAVAEAAAVSEAQMHERHPERWLRAAARSLQEETEWRGPPASPAPAGTARGIDFSKWSDEELREEILRITSALGATWGDDGEQA